MNKEYNPLNAVMKSFTLMWVLTAVGMYIGTLVSPALATIASVFAIILLVVAIFVRSYKVSKWIAYLVPFLSGIMLVWTTQFYIEALGKNLVLLIFVGTVATFILLGVLGSALSKNLEGMGKYLMAVLLVIIVISLVVFFVPVSNMVHLVIAAVTILLFVLYTVYDFNQIRHNPPTIEEVPMVALNLYLDFKNLFLAVLRIVLAIKEELK